jgi:[ribosomal protein S5]-alanine N-acetyltransferase
MLSSEPDVHAPELMEAGRVWLRRARLADAPGLFTSYARDPRATRYLSWPPRRSVGEVEEWLAPRVARWELGEEYRWVLVDHPHGEAFGTVSLRRSEQGFDLGYALAMPRSGNGIATDVVQRVLAWVDESPASLVVSASTDPENVASSRVLEKCGFHLARRDVASWTRPSIGCHLRDALIFERRSCL